jgi:hypothetical protein
MRFKDFALEKIEKIQQFKKGTKFFIYDTAGFNAFESDIGANPKKVVGCFNQVKMFLKWFIGMTMFGLIVWKYLSILGS